MEVTIETFIEINGVERDVKLTYYCTPGECPSYDSPGCDPDAEYQRGVFCDTGEDVGDAIDPADYEDDAVEKFCEIGQRAEEREAAAEDAAQEAKADARRDGE
jgi:hypothetical protein